MSKYGEETRELSEIILSEELGTTNTNTGILTNFRGEYRQSMSYTRGDMVLTNGFVSVVKQEIDETFDYPAPQFVGDEQNVYNGTIGSSSVTAKQVLFGTRYTTEALNVSLNGYRVDVIAGNHYTVYSVDDPLGAHPTTREVANFEANVTGWLNINIPPVIVVQGRTFDVVVGVSEPDPTPTFWTSDWNYTTPNNTGTPTDGVIIHSNSNTESFRINKLDNLLASKATELEALTVGDIINMNGSSWSIQTITDNTTWMDFTISPAVQTSPDGVTTVRFETVTATPITYGLDINYFLGETNKRGLFVVDGGYADIAVTDDAYGIDILVQEVIQSEDWDILMASDNAATGSTGTMEIQTFPTYTGGVSVGSGASQQTLHFVNGLLTTVT